MQVGCVSEIDEVNKVGETPPVKITRNSVKSIMAYFKALTN